MTEDARVRERVDAVLHIMGGLGGTYGKGRPLVNALEDVAQEAIIQGDFAFAQRFQRFAAYAGGELFLDILENYYDDEARQRSEKHMRRMAALGADRAVAALDVLCRDKPGASAADARDLFRGIAQSVDYLGLGDGEGGIRLSTKEARRLQEYGHMEMVLRNLPRPASAEAARMMSDVLADVDAGMLAQLLELRARQVGLAALRTAVEDPDSSESALHGCLKNQEWIFGGAYVAELVRRQYTPDAIRVMSSGRSGDSLGRRLRVGEALALARGAQDLRGHPPGKSTALLRGERPMRGQCPVFVVEDHLEDRLGVALQGGEEFLAGMMGGRPQWSCPSRSRARRRSRSARPGRPCQDRRGAALAVRTVAVLDVRRSAASTSGERCGLASCPFWPPSFLRTLCPPAAPLPAIRSLPTVNSALCDAC
nr:hypothetical protein [Streptomyces cupreus]